MNKELQKKILEIILDSGGFIEWRALRAKVGGFYFAHKKQIPPDITVVHNLDLLEENSEVLKIVEIPSISYKILAWGHYQFEPFYKKWFYFLMYRKHNLFSLLAFIISLAALIISIVK